MQHANVTCATFRSPESNPFIRTYGLINLIAQMQNQDYDGPVTISLIDDSETPHTFAEIISKAQPEKVLYVHAPTRETLREALLEQAPEMAKLVPSDTILEKASLLLLQEKLRTNLTITEADLKLAKGDFDLTKEEWDSILDRTEYAPVSTNRAEQLLASRINDEIINDPEAIFWKKRLSEVRTYGSLVPFEEDYPIQTNIYQQVFSERATIGMKKNAANALAEKQFGTPDVLIYADDDDHHAPHYIKASVEALGDHDFTRMTQYLTYAYDHDDKTRSQAGKFHLPVQKEANGYWSLPFPAKNKPMYLWLGDEKRYIEKTIGSKFSRPVSLAWPILSHEGALHTFSFDTWKQSVDTVGGASPTSFCEDIIYYRMLKDHLGNNFTDALTPIKPGEEAFLRIADGSNASLVEVTEHITIDDMPKWAKETINFLHEAQSAPRPNSEETLTKLAKDYLQTGKLDITQHNKPCDMGFTPK